MISMCSLRSSIVMPELARDLRHLVVLQQPQVLGDDLLGRRALEAEVPELQQQALLQVARGDADRIELWTCCSARSTSLDRPRPHRRELVDRRDQVAVVVEVADDGGADLAQLSRRRSAARAATSGDRRASCRSRACSRSAAAP